MPENIFERINNWIEAVESSFITLITTLIPWLAPALPAYLTYYHLSEMVHVPPAVSIMMALSVEFLGLSAVSSAFQAMRHNKRNKAKYKKVSVGFPVGAYIFYLVVILTVNVALELPLSEEWHGYMQIGAIALLTLISAPAFIIVISRQQRHEVNKPTAKRDIVVPKSDIQLGTNGTNYAKMTIADIMDREGVSRRTAYRRKEQATNAHKRKHGA